MMPPFIKRAFIYQLGNMVACSPVSRLSSGGGVGTVDVFCCDTLVPLEVGHCLVAALEKSIDDVPPESTNPKDHRNAVLRVTHAKSWRAFHAKAKLVIAYQKPGSRKVKLTPTRAEGGGSAHLDEKERHSSVIPSELGAAVLAALEDAE